MIFCMLELGYMEVLKRIKTIITTALSKLIDCIVPALPIMIGVGMLNVILIILGPTVLNILSSQSSCLLLLMQVIILCQYILLYHLQMSLIQTDILQLCVEEYFFHLLSLNLLMPMKSYRFSIFQLFQQNTEIRLSHL